MSKDKGEDISYEGKENKRGVDVFQKKGRKRNILSILYHMCTVLCVPGQILL